MARPKKKGLDYIPLDVHFFDDRKIRKLNSKYSGGKASYIFLRLLTEIYQNSFYVELDDDDITFLSYESKIRKSVFEQILKDLISEGYFNEELYKTYNILTSEEIQRQYFSIKNSKSKVYIDDKETNYLLIDVSNFKNIILQPAKNEPETNQKPTENEPETNQKPTENEPKTNQKPTENEPKTNQKPTENEPKTNQKPTENSPSKVKKSKVKKSKGGNNRFSAENSAENQPKIPPLILKKLNIEKLNNAEQEIWAKTYEALKRNLSEKDILKLIDFALQDEFWKQNFFALPYLTKKSKTDGVEMWRKIHAQMHAKKEKQQVIENPQNIDTNVKII